MVVQEGGQPIDEDNGGRRRSGGGLLPGTALDGGSESGQMEAVTHLVMGCTRQRRPGSDGRRSFGQ